MFEQLSSEKKSSGGFPQVTLHMSTTRHFGNQSLTLEIGCCLLGTFVCGKASLVACYGCTEFVCLLLFPSKPVLLNIFLKKKQLVVVKRCFGKLNVLLVCSIQSYKVRQVPRSSRTSSMNVRPPTALHISISVSGMVFLPIVLPVCGL